MKSHQEINMSSFPEIFAPCVNPVYSTTVKLSFFQSLKLNPLIGFQFHF